jgi:single-stranded-DNA-specific exonuclease
MKFRLKREKKVSENYLIDLLKDREISDYNAFLAPSVRLEEPFELLDHIDEAYNLLTENWKEGVLILVDCDADGYTSAAVMWNYLKEKYPEIDMEYILHTGKQHGLEDTWKDILASDKKLIIIPDASSNDEEFHKILKEEGKVIIILDHHEAEKYSNYACVVNNQLSELYPNKSLSGVGVVYKFCTYCDMKDNTDFAKNYLDLVAVGMIGDMMKITALENRYLYEEGLSKINNYGLQKLIEKQSFSIGDIAHLTPTKISFYIAPLINAVIRVGKMEEKKILFEALTNGDTFVPSTKRGARAGETESIAEQNARNCTNARSRQNRAKEKAMDLLEMEICKNGLDENKIIIVEVEDDSLDTTLTGLVAMNLVTKYQRPVLVVREDTQGFLRGSGRGLEKSELKDFKQFLTDSGFFDYAEGHANAFGGSIHKNNVDKFTKYANEKLKDVKFDEGVYEVDFHFGANDDELKTAITQIGSRPELWSQGNDEPYFAVDGISLSCDDINIIGKGADTLKFTVNGVTYIMFKANELIEKVSGKQEFSLEIIGRANLNEWAGSITPQILIEDYNFRNTLLDF